MAPRAFTDNAHELDMEAKQETYMACIPTSTSVGVSPASIDPAKERDALLRFDYIVLPQLAILVIIGWLDRANIGMSKT